MKRRTSGNMFVDMTADAIVNSFYNAYTTPFLGILCWSFPVGLALSLTPKWMIPTPKMLGICDKPPEPKREAK